MTPAEKRAGVALAAIFGLRMLGLFLILPVFAIHARTMPGGDSAALVGIALGAYGLTQMLLQIPFGMASGASRSSLWGWCCLLLVPPWRRGLLRWNGSSPVAWYRALGRYPGRYQPWQLTSHASSTAPK